MCGLLRPRLQCRHCAGPFNGNASNKDHLFDYTLDAFNTVEVTDEALHGVVYPFACNTPLLLPVPCLISPGTTPTQTQTIEQYI